MGERALNFAHQKALVDPDRIGKVTVIGGGGVGSQVVMALARVGVTDIALYDGDRISSHNIPASFVFGFEDVGLLKMEVVAKEVERKTGVKIKAIPQMYAGEPLRGTVIVCVDTMSARSLIWKEVKDNPLVDTFVDTRIAAELVHVYGLRPHRSEHQDLYESRLYPDSETVRVTCGSHGIIHVTCHAAMIAVGYVAKIRAGIELPPVHEFTFATLEQLG